ncbi:hypothetical protein TNCV_528581 [Trichonephila clavipes]|nr:hypothetical protein TNCV_528581 [Trichonephila clavipes]
MLYHRTILEPHMAYPIPAGTNYIVLTFHKTAFDSTCPRPVQIPLVPEPPVQIPQSPVQIPDVPEPVKIPVSQVPQPPLCRFHMSQNHLCRFPQNHLCRFHSLCRFYMSQNLCRFQSLCRFPRARPFGADGYTCPIHVVRFEPPDQELQLFHTVLSIFDGDLISFLDEFERELVPMDLIMPRLDPCVKKSIGFKAIQPMDLSVNSCL